MKKRAYSIISVSKIGIVSLIFATSFFISINHIEAGTTTITGTGKLQFKGKDGATSNQCSYCYVYPSNVLKKEVTGVGTKFLSEVRGESSPGAGDGDTLQFGLGAMFGNFEGDFTYIPNTYGYTRGKAPKVVSVISDTELTIDFEIGCLTVNPNFNSSNCYYWSVSTGPTAFKVVQQERLTSYVYQSTEAFTNTNIEKCPCEVSREKTECADSFDSKDVGSACADAYTTPIDNDSSGVFYRIFKKKDSYVTPSSQTKEGYLVSDGSIVKATRNTVSLNPSVQSGGLLCINHICAKGDKGQAWGWGYATREATKLGRLCLEDDCIRGTFPVMPSIASQIAVDGGEQDGQYKRVTANE